MFPDEPYAHYEDAQQAAADAWSQLLSDRLTLSRKRAQLREAVVEEADDQADYFELRTEEMEQVVQQGEARYATLVATAEELRVSMTTEEINTLLRQYRATLTDLATQLQPLASQISEAASLVHRAEERAQTLPTSATAPRRAVDAAADRLAEIETLLNQLDAACADNG